jgi:hypothetical protein
MNTREVLIAARKKIERPECWTQRAYARDEEYSTVSPSDKLAVCWCSIGALCAVTDDNGQFAHARDSLAAVLDGMSVFCFNDTHTHAEVLAAFDRAIELETK